MDAVDADAVEADAMDVDPSPADLFRFQRLTGRKRASSSAGRRLAIAGSSSGGDSVRGAITSVLLYFLFEFLTHFLPSFRLAQVSFLFSV